MTRLPHGPGQDVDTATGELVPVQTAPPMSPTPIGDQALAASLNGRAELTPFQASLEALLAPHTLDLQQWAEALFKVRDFPDQDPDEQTNAMLASILLAGSSEEALAAMALDRAKQLCGDEPGGHSPVLTITDARPLASEYDEGPACYVIVSATIKATGQRIRFTTGAAAVQAVILAHIGNGWIPFDAQLQIRAQKTRRGYYPLNLTAGG